MSANKRFISEEEALDVLKAAEYGVLSTASAQGRPYGVPVNYCYVPEENCIFFHCARVGRKLDNIMQNPKVSFVAVANSEVIQERFTTHYESVVVDGTAQLVEDEAEKIAKMVILCERFSPKVMDKADEVIRKHLSAVAVVKIIIDSVQGKRNQDL
jgi:uncharacterized protein